MNETYLTDFNSWIDQTAQSLRERRWHEIDAEQLIAEVEDLGLSLRDLVRDCGQIGERGLISPSFLPDLSGWRSLPLADRCQLFHRFARQTDRLLLP